MVNHKRVLRLLREDNLLCLRQRAFVPATTDSRHGWKVHPNLARWLVPTTTNQLWVADITSIRLAEAFVYLAVVLDAYSRRMVGWAMADHLRAELAMAALRMALGSRQVVAGALVHHSDRGVQYACGEYMTLLEAYQIQPSMSRPGCPYDNAMAESFMKTLKQEEVDGRSYRDLAEARASIGPVHRPSLQPTTTALRARLPSTGRVRGDDFTARGCCAAAPGHSGNRLSLIPCLSLGVQSSYVTGLDLLLGYLGVWIKTTTQARAGETGGHGQ